MVARRMAMMRRNQGYMRTSHQLGLLASLARKVQVFYEEAHLVRRAVLAVPVLATRQADFKGMEMCDGKFKDLERD